MRAHYGDHVLDGEGRPIAGAAVYVYQHGTSTPITETIYTTDDTAGSTVASNPLSTSASGRYDIWLTDEKRVTLKITKAGFQDQTFDVDVIELNPTGASNITLRENSGANVGTRPRINLIEGTGIALTLADDAVDNEVDVTVATAAAYQAISEAGGKELGYAQATGNQTGIATTDTDLTGLSVTVTCDGVRPILITGKVQVRQNTAAALFTELSIKEGTTVLSVSDEAHYAAGAYANHVIQRRLLPTAGSHIYKLTLRTANNTCDAMAAAAFPNFIQAIQLGV